MKNFELVSHTADLQIRVYGASLQQLFENAVIGMFQAIKPKPIDVNCSYIHDRLVCKNLPISRQISVQSLDVQTLLVDFLSEILVLSDVHNEAYLQAKVSRITPTTIEAVIYGIAIQGFEVVEIKAVTYAGMNIQEQQGIWSTDIIFDI